MQFSYTYHGEIHTLQLDQQADGSYLARISDRTILVEVRRAADGGLLLSLNGEHAIAYSAASGTLRYVQVDAAHYTLALPETRRKRGSGAGGAASLNAEMPGQVIEVLVRAGDAVQRGQTLLILEAMKMEMRIAAPAAGVIQAVSVAKGDVVERGQLLVELAASG